MKKEEEEWWNSVHDMLDVTQTTKKSWDGITEDMLLSPPVESPQPGDVGFAPQNKIGSL